jgi:hypothetical protein
MIGPFAHFALKDDSMAFTDRATRLRRWAASRRTLLIGAGINKRTPNISLVLALLATPASAVGAHEFNAQSRSEPIAIAQAAPTNLHAAPTTTVPAPQSAPSHDPGPVSASPDGGKTIEGAPARRRTRGVPTPAAPSDPQAAPIEGQKDLIDVVQPRRQ